MINFKKSFTSSFEILPDLRLPYMHAHASADMNGDGFEDVVAAFTNFGEDKKNQIRIFLGDGAGGFVDGTNSMVAGLVPELYQGREIALADFNGDGRTDIYVIDSGIDAPPNTPGGKNFLLLSNDEGKLAVADSPELADFSHTTIFGDIDNDGDIDLFVGNFLSAGTHRLPYFLINDGGGAFAQSTNRVPTVERQNLGPQIGASLLEDVNADGYLDLILGDWGNGQSRIYFGNAAGDFSNVTKTRISTPKILGDYGEAADIVAADFDGDGDLDLVLTFVGPTGNYLDPASYANRYVQLLINDGNGVFTDETATRLPLAANEGDEVPSKWFVFLEAADVNSDGLIDIVAKNLNSAGQPASDNTPAFWLNLGKGYFYAVTETAFGSEYGFPNGYPSAFELVDANSDGKLDLFTFGYRAELLTQTGPLTVEIGSGGDDIFIGKQTGIVIDGLSGNDAALYGGNNASFTISLNVDGNHSVLNRSDSAAVADKLKNLEHLSFTTGNDVNLSILDGVVNVSAADLSAFIEIYIAYFNRAPDAEGLYYWGTRLNEGMSKQEIAKSFYVQPETQALYSNPDDTEGFVTAVYRNFLGRAPDAEGFAYWVNQLNTEAVSKPIFLLAIINGAKAMSGDPKDVDYFTNKANIGAYYSVIKGMSNVENAKVAMGLYDGSTDSIAAAKNAIDDYFAAASDANNGELLINLVGVLDDPFVDV